MTRIYRAMARLEAVIMDKVKDEGDDDTGEEMSARRKLLFELKDMAVK